MLEITLLIALLIYQYFLVLPKGWLVQMGFLIVSLILLGGIYMISWLFPLVCLILYGYNHPHFLKEEKLFAGLIAIFYLLLMFFSYQVGSFTHSIITGLFYFVLEYFHQRIMKREEDKTIIYQNKLIKQQVDEIDQMYQTMRGWRHDYHNHLQSLKGFLTLRQTKQMRDYLDDLEQDLDSIDTFYHSGNLQLDAILNSKLAIAEQDQIHLNCHAQVPPKLHVNDIDLCVVVGNLMDNAIESCRKITLIEERFIRIYISVMRKQLYISITNATSESVKKRSDQYFTNKRGDHGHGLQRVDQVVAKYEGYLNRQNEPGVFATEIILPL